MDEMNKDNKDWEEQTRQDEVPEIVQKEPDDKPAANNLRWTIIIAVIVLLVIYLIFFYRPS